MSLFSKDILALDWDHRQLRAVSARISQGRAVVRRMFQESLPGEVTGDDPAQFGKWLKTVLSKNRCRSGRVLMAIPRDQVVLKTLLLPANTPPLELPALVQFQMQKELPFPVDSAVIDYTVAGENGASASTPAEAAPAAQIGIELPVTGEKKPPAMSREYLVAATRKEVIDYYRKVASAAELDLHRLGLRCFSNLQMLRSCGPTDSTKRLLLVNVGPELTEIDIIRGGGLLFSRSASVALSERDDPTEFLNRLALEVIRSVQAARAAVADLELDGCVVAAPDWLASSIAERLAQRLDVPGWVLEPGRGELKLPAEHRRGGGEFCAALGLVLGQTRGKVPPFDFLHPHKPVNLISLKKQKRRTALLAATAAAVFLLAGNFMALTITDETERLRKQAVNLEQDARRVEAMAGEIERMKMFARSPNWLDEFVKINDAWMPGGAAALHENAFIDQFEGEITNDGWAIRLRGAARNPQTVVDIRQQLAKLYPPPFAISRDKQPGQYNNKLFSHSFEEGVRFTPPANDRRK